MREADFSGLPVRSRGDLSIFTGIRITDGMFDPAYRDWFGKCDGCGERGVLVLRDFVKIERLCARCCDEE